MLTWLLRLQHGLRPWSTPLKVGISRSRGEGRILVSTPGWLSRRTGSTRGWAQPVRGVRRLLELTLGRRPVLNPAAGPSCRSVAAFTRFTDRGESVRGPGWYGTVCNASAYSRDRLSDSSPPHISSAIRRVRVKTRAGLRCERVWVCTARPARAASTASQLSCAP